MCDPWENQMLLDAMQIHFPQESCRFCLPECNHVIYQQTVSSQKFRKCDEKNFGMSDLVLISPTILNPKSLTILQLKIIFGICKIVHLDFSKIFRTNGIIL